MTCLSSEADANAHSSAVSGGRLWTANYGRSVFLSPLSTLNQCMFSEYVLIRTGYEDVDMPIKARRCSPMKTQYLYDNE